MQVYVNPTIDEENIDLIIAIVLDSIKDYEKISDIENFTDLLIKEIKLPFIMTGIINADEIKQMLDNTSINIKNLFLTYFDKIKEFIELKKFDKISLLDFTDYGKINISIIKSDKFMSSVDKLNRKNKNNNVVDQKIEENEKKINEIDKLISDFEKWINQKNS